MAKTVYMVFNNKEKIAVASRLFENFRYVFEDFIKVKTCFLDEIDKGDILDGDLFTVLFRERVYLMKDYVPSLDRVIVLSRTIQRKFLPDILSIPDGTNVLVVNDSPESTLQTANTLYELGINHINLIPFEERLDADDYYKNIKIAITPNEVSMVPKHIKNVININDRFIDLNTFVTIINKLDLNNEKITRNLIKYTDLIVGNEMGVNQKYMEDHLKSEMLKRMIHHSQEAVLLTDHHYMLVYANDRAETLFGIDLFETGTNGNFCELCQENGIDLTAQRDWSNKLLCMNGTNYIVNKNPIMILDQIVGYSILLNDEQNIKNIENDLNKQLVKGGLVSKYSFEDIICGSDKMRKCITVAKKAALTDYAVMINGQSGTGKELVAQSIHSYSNRKNNPFVAINCAALPENLLESELFGYEKGAFTGALSSGKLGLFEQATKGTIFLDEIGDMSLNLQARLLRVLQEKQIMRLGSDKLIDIDIRVIAATNKNLTEEVRNKTFREDLYYRLCNIPILLPPLSERRDDILLIFASYLGLEFERLTELEQNYLKNYNWPGNVRELLNAANYFKTLGELPPAIYDIALPEASQRDSLKRTILHIIKIHTQGSCGIGRTAILHEIKKGGINYSDDKMRKFLGQLESSGYIAIGKGRTGCRILEPGEDFLRE